MMEILCMYLIFPLCGVMQQSFGQLVSEEEAQLNGTSLMNSTHGMLLKWLQQDEYLNKIMRKYGKNDALQLEELMTSLFLGLLPDYSPGAGYSKSEYVSLMKMLWKRNSEQSKDCLPPQDVLDMHNLTSPVNSSGLVMVCPTLLYLLDSHACPSTALIRSPAELQASNESDHDHDHDHDDSHDDHDHGHHDHQGKLSQLEVWGFSILTCVILSAVGLVAVVIIPLIHKRFYNHLLQFLVSMAIGSLAGDALFHLLPHSLESSMSGGHSVHSHDEDDQGVHSPAIWQGVTAFAGMYVFFLIERVMSIYSEMKQKKMQPEPQAELSTIPDDVSLGSNRKERTASTPRPYTSRASVTEGHLTASCNESTIFVHSSKVLRKFAQESHDDLHPDCDIASKDETFISHKHKKEKHHGHSHSVPSSTASVIWMVIVGDGLHNLCDGLAIGSAFASSLGDGISTGVAVFAHELPHELGDFAMLLRAGMSTKMALFYNLVSSILCLVGVIIGVAVGNASANSMWIFSVIAGIFIYVALVDMMPELMRIDPADGENPGFHLLLQNCGILTGAVIMLLIALFEHKIVIEV